MTNFQKAFCIMLSICFFSVLAILPASFFTEENVYRHLPLYRFLEKKAQTFSYEDRETYERIVGENGQYLGKRAQSEQRAGVNQNDAIEKSVKSESGVEEQIIAEKESNVEEQIIAEKESNVEEQIIAEKESDMEEQIIAEKESDVEEKIITEQKNDVGQKTSEESEIEQDFTSESQSSEEFMDSQDSEKFTDSSNLERSSIKGKDIIEKNPELADFEYVLSQFYIVDSATATNAEQIDARKFLGQDLTIAKDPAVPQILIYHSHSQETFADSREGVEEDTIVGVGEYLTKILTEQYGYQVIHLKEQFDLAGGELDRSSAYDYARGYLEDFLQENPDIQVVIDLHRDGVPENRRLVTEINGKPTAQILFYNGLSYTVNTGALDYLPNPYLEDNLAFSFQLEYQAAQDYPEFYRGIYLAGYRYNLHFRPRSILLEAGAQTNTVQEVKNAMEPFADVLDKVLQGK